MELIKQASLLSFDILALVLLWRCSSFLIHQYFTKRTTILYNLPDLGRARPDEKRIKGTAVVCGGSFAGLWSARFLADHFEDVIVVDPESWLETPEGWTSVYDAAGERIRGREVHTRSRVFQYHTTHAFQPMFYAVLKMLYPSVDDEVRKMDGRIGNSDFRTYLLDNDKKFLAPPKNVNGEYPQNMYLSRASCERLLRRLFIRDSQRIRWITGAVKGVNAAEGDINTLTSVTVRMPDSSEKIIPASLVVDCTGTSQAGLKWLRRMGAETDKSVGGRLALNDPRLRLSYCTNQQTRTFYFPVPPEARAKLPIPGGYNNAMWIYTYTPFLGHGRKSVFVDRLEGHRIRIMVGTWGDLPLPDFDELRDFFEEFNPYHKIPEWLSHLVDSLIEHKESAHFLTSKYPVLSRVQYEKASYIPSNFVAVGDSVMQVNPTFGQGCSKACVGAVALDGVLRSRNVINSTAIPAGFSSRFFKEHARKTDVAWEGTKPLDYLFPSTVPVQGETLKDEWFSGKVSTTLLLLTQKDQKMNDAAFRSFTFFGPPIALMNPVFLTKVLMSWTREYFGLCEFPQC